jgi:Putative DNA-binding domain
VASPDPSLARIQEWMQRVVLNTADLDVSLGAPEAQAVVPREQLARVILPSRTLTPAQRVGIYHGMYPLRMVEALEADYGALAHFLGEEAFTELVCRYVTAHPSQSYTLNRLGDHLPEFIASAASGVKRPAFAADLASLERAIAQVFDADESPVLEAEGIAAIGDRVSEAHVRTVAAVRLLSFRYPVNAYLQSVRDEHHDHPRAAAQATWVLVFRRSYVVRRLELSRAQHTLLAALASGQTIGAAALATLQSSHRRLQPEEFFGWFREWVAAGVFQSVTL